VPQKICTAVGANKARRNEKKATSHGDGHVKITFNDSIASIINDTGGAAIAWSSTGRVSLEGWRMSPFQPSASPSWGEE
jgi:small subunit ribosomal protein S11